MILIDILLTPISIAEQILILNRARQINSGMTRIQELEKITAFAVEHGISIYDICVIYGQYRELDRVSGKKNAYSKTMEYIYNHS